MRLRRTPRFAVAATVSAVVAMVVPATAMDTDDRVVHDALQGVAHHLARPTSPRPTGERFDATETTWRVDAPGVTDYLIIGASMATVFVADWGRTAYDALAARHEFFLDARGCRTLTGPSCKTPSQIAAPPNTIDALRTRAGTFDKGLVILVGANDPEGGDYGMDASITAILAEAKRQGIRWVVWFTYNEASSVGAKLAHHNRVLLDRAADDPRLVIGDWNALVKTLPRSWLLGDGIHLSGSAALALGDLIGDTLDLIDAAGPGRTVCALTLAKAGVGGAVLVNPDSGLNGTATGMVRASRLQVSCPT